MIFKNSHFIENLVILLTFVLNMFCDHGIQFITGYLCCLLVQAESAMDQMDWIEKITGVIASLLNSQSPERVNIRNSSLEVPVHFLTLMLII